MIIDKDGRSITVCTVLMAKALAFGTFNQAAETFEGRSGMVVTVGSTLTRLLHVCASDGVEELIRSLLNDQINNSGMSYSVVGIVLVSNC